MAAPFRRTAGCSAIRLRLSSQLEAEPQRANSADTAPPTTTTTSAPWHNTHRRTHSTSPWDDWCFCSEHSGFTLGRALSLLTPLSLLMWLTQVRVRALYHNRLAHHSGRLGQQTECSRYWVSRVGSPSTPSAINILTQNDYKCTICWLLKF